MGLVSSLRKTLYNARSVAYGLDREFRPHSVEVVQILNGGAHPGAGSDATVITTIREARNSPPRVRTMSDEERAVGALADGTLEIGPITPAFPGGGTDLSILDGRDLETNDQLYIRITGPMNPDGALYKIKNRVTDRALRYMLQVTPVSEG